MSERRPNLKRPGVTATGRQWQTIRALRADGWIVLEADFVPGPDPVALTRAQDGTVTVQAMEQVAMLGSGPAPTDDPVYRLIPPTERTDQWPAR